MDCISVLKQMIGVREGRRSCHVFNIDDVLHIINDIYVHQIVKIFYHFCTNCVDKDIIQLEVVQITMHLGYLIERCIHFS